MQMSTHAWQQAWDLAQPRLQATRQSLPSIPHASPRVLRVGQLDAELLDQELLQMLTDPLTKAIGLIHSSYRSRFEPEVMFIVHVILYKFSVWDLGATYGAKLQNLRYKAPKISSSSAHLAPSGLPTRTLWLHAMATILVPYTHARLRVYALSRAWPDAPSSDIRRKAWNVLTQVESAHNALSVASFVVFLCDGRYRTWADRLLHMRLVPAQRTSSRQVSYEFMNRQMVWHAFTEFLLFLLPLINTRVLRRRISHAASHVSITKLMPSFVTSFLGIQGSPETVNKGKGVEERGKYWSLPEDQCAICAEDASFSIIPSRFDQYPTRSTPVSSTSPSTPTPVAPQFPVCTPYITSCLHQYCYVCLSERMLKAADDGEPAWECLRCGAMVVTAERVDGRSKEEAGSDDLDMTEASFVTDDVSMTTRE